MRSAVLKLHNFTTTLRKWLRSVKWSCVYFTILKLEMLFYKTNVHIFFVRVFCFLYFYQMLILSVLYFCNFCSSLVLSVLETCTFYTRILYFLFWSLVISELETCTFCTNLVLSVLESCSFCTRVLYFMN